MEVFVGLLFVLLKCFIAPLPPPLESLDGEDSSLEGDFSGPRKGLDERDLFLMKDDVLCICGADLLSDINLQFEAFKNTNRLILAISVSTLYHSIRHDPHDTGTLGHHTTHRQSTVRISRTLRVGWVELIVDI